MTFWRDSIPFATRCPVHIRNEHNKAQRNKSGVSPIQIRQHDCDHLPQHLFPHFPAYCSYPMPFRQCPQWIRLVHERMDKRAPKRSSKNCEPAVVTSGTDKVADVKYKLRPLKKDVEHPKHSSSFWWHK